MFWSWLSLVSCHVREIDISQVRLLHNEIPPDSAKVHHYSPLEHVVEVQCYGVDYNTF